MDTPTKEAGIVLVIKDRRFRKTEVTTLDQDAYVMKRMRQFGLADMAKTFDPKVDDISEFAQSMILAAFESGQLYEILGGMLVEEGTTWSRDVAATNAAFFSSLTDINDKREIYSNIATVLLDFLTVAAALSKNSRRYSGGFAPTLAADRSHSGEIRGMTTGNGIPSSESLPSTTPTTTIE